MDHRTGSSPQGFTLPRPGKALKGVLLALLGTWVAYAVGINWAGAHPDLFLLLCGNTDKILGGEIWRLFTASLLHFWRGSAGFGHILTALLILYFLSPSLEEKWGAARFLRFLVLSSVIAFVIQMLADKLLPESAAARLAESHMLPGYWFGAVPAGEAVAIAWALSFRGQTVRLMFILPVTSTGLIVFVVAVSILRVISVAETFEGLIAPFGGMLAGWMLGGTPSPARRLYLRLRLRQLAQRAEDDDRRRKRRVRRSGLRVIDGGKSGDAKDDDDDDDRRGPDGGYLN